MPIQEATRRETLHIAVGVTALTALENGVCALLRRWSSSLLLGSALGAVTAVANFFLLALTVQRVTAAPDEQRGKAMLHFSYAGRTLLQLGIIILAISLGHTPPLATALPLLFPRITIFIMQLLGMYKPDAPTAPEGGDESV